MGAVITRLENAAGRRADVVDVGISRDARDRRDPVSDRTHVPPFELLVNVGCERRGLRREKDGGRDNGEDERDGALPLADHAGLLSDGPATLHHMVDD